MSGEVARMDPVSTECVVHFWLLCKKRAGLFMIIIDYMKERNYLHASNKRLREFATSSVIHNIIVPWSFKSLE